MKKKLCIRNVEVVPDNEVKNLNLYAAKFLAQRIEGLIEVERHYTSTIPSTLRGEDAHTKWLRFLRQMANSFSKLSIPRAFETLKETESDEIKYGLKLFADNYQHLCN